MGTKQSKVKEPVTAIPVEAGREPQVAKEPEQSFDERTLGTAPFLREDGTQENGATTEEQ
jgi:hypothetical protein